MSKRMSSYSLLGLLVLLGTILLSKEACARTDHEAYFKNTDYELNVYKIYGREKGKTLMIIGGIQGDEPGGYLAADLYADMALRKGSLIVVPRANFLSIIENKRAINGDMNRRFQPIDKQASYEDKVVEILKGLISQSDYLLNLHEGSGFFSERWESNLKNPMRFGQSIIADAGIYYILEVNGLRQVVSDGERLKVVKGDRIKLLDVGIEGLKGQDVMVNFLGFVRDRRL